MIRFRRMMLTTAVCAMAASAFVGCSDDNFPEHRMGAVGVNSLQTTSTTATAYWTIVSNGSCDGYTVTVNKGTRENLGAEVEKKDIDNPRTHYTTFSGLEPNSEYVITTQAKPSKSSGCTTADTYQMYFMTAPIISGISYGGITYYDVEIKEKDENGQTVTKIVKRGSFKTTWDAIAAKNCGSYTASLQLKMPDESWASVTTVSTTNASENSAEFDKVIIPNSVYRVVVNPNPGNVGFYARGETSNGTEFTAPAAQ